MTDTPKQDSSDDLGPLPPGRATRDYARDSMAPFQPLVTNSTPAPGPATSGTGNLPLPAVLIGVSVVSAVAVIGLGLFFLT